MRSLPWRIRAAALISVGAIGVHDLRYLIAYRGSTAHELSITGHGYLGVVTPLAMGALALAVAAFAMRLLLGSARAEHRLPTTRRLWLFASAALVAIYCCQEWVEGQVAAGHPGGMAALVGHGGWIALPLALGIALVIALLLRGAEAVIARAASPRSCTWLRARGVVEPVAPPVWLPRAGDGIARSLAPRGPPCASV